MREIPYYKKKMSQRLRDIRDECGQGQHLFADLSGVPRTPYENWEKENHSAQPRVDQVQKIIEHYREVAGKQVDVMYLYGLQDQESLKIEDAKADTGLSTKTLNKLFYDLENFSYDKTEKWKYRWYRSYLSLLEFIVNDERIGVMAFKNAEAEEDIKKAEEIVQNNPKLKKVIAKTKKELEQYELINVNDLQTLQQRYFLIAKEEGLENPEEYLYTVNAIFEKRNLPTRTQALIQVITDVVKEWSREAEERERRIEEEHTTKEMPV